MCFRKTVLSVFTVAAVIACSSNPTCTVKGTVSGQADSVFLINGKGDNVSACAVKNGSFTLVCDLDATQGVSVVLGENREPISLVPDSKEIIVKIEEGNVSVSGSPLSEELQALQKWMLNHFMSHNEKAMALIESGDQNGADALMQEMHNEMADHCREVYLNHSQDPVGVQAMTMLAYDLPEDEFIRLYEMGGECIREDAMIAGRYESLTAALQTVIQRNPDGSGFSETKGSLESFVGKGAYVLVDFWASWCGPCKEETPYVVKAYNEYKDKGLLVLGIPVQDKLDATREAMGKMGVNYPQLLDPQGDLAGKYGVTGIPHLFLFGPDGECLKEGMRGEMLDAVLKPLFQ